MRRASSLPRTSRKATIGAASEPLTLSTGSSRLEECESGPPVPVRRQANPRLPRVKRSGLSVYTSTRTSPCTPCALATRPTWIQSGLAPTLVDNLDAGTLAALDGTSFDNRAESFSNPALLTNHLAHVVLGNM